MENPYLVGSIIAAVVIILIVWMLRNRITKGSAEVSLDERKASASFEAAKPTSGGKQDGKRGSTPQGVSENVSIGRMSVWANLRARIFRNWNIGRMDITVTDAPPPAPTAAKPEPDEEAQ